MAVPQLSPADFVEQLKLLGATRLAKKLGITERNVYRRKAYLKTYFDIPTQTEVFKPKEYPHRANISVKNGYVIVGSDFHIWPGSNGTALRAFKKLTDDIRPAAVILNGDVMDFPKISRHPPIGWENTPSPQAEIEAAQDHLNDIAKASRRAEKRWTLGNHDARFETRLATVAPEFARVAGIHLADHFPIWGKAWSVWINDSVVCKHRFKGGANAPKNNTIFAGKTMITGHLHAQGVRQHTDYNGTRYGVDTGCVADPDHTAFVGYTEDNPLDWRSGFAILKFVEGRLMEPQLVSVWDDKRVQWRGELVKV